MPHPYKKGKCPKEEEVVPCDKIEQCCDRANCVVASVDCVCVPTVKDLITAIATPVTALPVTGLLPTPTEASPVVTITVPLVNSDFYIRLPKELCTETRILWPLYGILSKIYQDSVASVIARLDLTTLPPVDTTFTYIVRTRVTLNILSDQNVVDPANPISLQNPLGQLVGISAGQCQGQSQCPCDARVVSYSYEISFIVTIDDDGDVTYSGIVQVVRPDGSIISIADIAGGTATEIAVFGVFGGDLTFLFFFVENPLTDPPTPISGIQFFPANPSPAVYLSFVQSRDRSDKDCGTRCPYILMTDLTKRSL